MDWYVCCNQHVKSLFNAMFDFWIQAMVRTAKCLEKVPLNTGIIDVLDVSWFPVRHRWLARIESWCEACSGWPCAQRNRLKGQQGWTKLEVTPPTSFLPVRCLSIKLWVTFRHDALNVRDATAAFVKLWRIEAESRKLQADMASEYMSTHSAGLGNRLPSTQSPPP